MCSCDEEQQGGREYLLTARISCEGMNRLQPSTSHGWWKMLGLLAILLLMLCHTADAASAALKQPLPPVDPECKLYARMAGLVVPYGYPLEEHFVETVS